MTYEHPGAGALDYFPCRYGASRLAFRGPRARLDRPYVAVLGGTETYGKFIATPWPALLAEETGHCVVNLAGVNAGYDLYLNDPSLIEIATGATHRIVQICGFGNLANRFYSVHPRRNDRFVQALAPLRQLYPDVDFTEFTFTRHLLTALARRGADRFERVAEELMSVWLARLGALAARIGGADAALWLGDAELPATGRRTGLGVPPVADLTRIRATLGPATAVIQVVEPRDSLPAEGMVFAPLEALAAATLPGPIAHLAAAEALTPILGRVP
jgi:hypothetical protein